MEKVIRTGTSIMPIVSESLKSQSEIDKLSNESDHLLSDRYKLTKKYKSLNKTLKDSNDQMKVLEFDLKSKLILNEQLDNNQKISDEIKILQDKIKYRDNANSDLKVEIDILNEQLKNIQIELAGLKGVEDEERLLK